MGSSFCKLRMTEKFPRNARCAAEFQPESIMKIRKRDAAGGSSALECPSVDAAVAASSRVRPSNPSSGKPAAAFARRVGRRGGRNAEGLFGIFIPPSSLQLRRVAWPGQPAATTTTRYGVTASLPWRRRVTCANCRRSVAHFAEARSPACASVRPPAGPPCALAICRWPARRVPRRCWSRPTHRCRSPG
jgi:hypothetical protein